MMIAKVLLALAAGPLLPAESALPTETFFPDQTASSTETQSPIETESLIETGKGKPTWSEQVVVLNGFEPVVHFQARLENDYLIVKAVHESGWHTYAMDNAWRASQALQGKKSLGIEQGIEIRSKSGLQLDNKWFQTSPQDLSKPEIRWFTYGFDKMTLFACRVSAITAERSVVQITGQACSGETCCQVDVELSLPTQAHPFGKQAGKADGQRPESIRNLVPVKGSENLTAKPVGRR